jgi:hypothetical protein
MTIGTAFGRIAGTSAALSVKSQTGQHRGPEIDNPSLSKEEHASA